MNATEHHVVNLIFDLNGESSFGDVSFWAKIRGAALWPLHSNFPLTYEFDAVCISNFILINSMTCANTYAKAIIKMKKSSAGKTRPTV